MEFPKYFYFRVKPKRHGRAVEIEDASDADVVEVVRCGECKHWDKESTFCLNIEGCYGNETTPNWFCADGERREE